MSSYIEKIRHEDAGIMLPSDVQARYSTTYTILPSSVISSSGNSDPIDVSDYLYGIIFVDVTAVSGTSPTLTIIIESQDPVSLKYAEITRKENITTIGTYAIQISNFGNKIRVRWILGGTTPSFTLSMGGIFKV